MMHFAGWREIIAPFFCPEVGTSRISSFQRSGTVDVCISESISLNTVIKWSDAERQVPHCGFKETPRMVNKEAVASLKVKFRKIPEFRFFAG